MPASKLRKGLQIRAVLGVFTQPAETETRPCGSSPTPGLPWPLRKKGRDPKWNLEARPIRG
jgi:hypothetical protein